MLPQLAAKDGLSFRVGGSVIGRVWLGTGACLEPPTVYRDPLLSLYPHSNLYTVMVIEMSCSKESIKHPLNMYQAYIVVTSVSRGWWFGHVA